MKKKNGTFGKFSRHTLTVNLYPANLSTDSPKMICFRKFKFFLQNVYLLRPLAKGFGTTISLVTGDINIAITDIFMGNLCDGILTVASFKSTSES